MSSAMIRRPFAPQRVGTGDAVSDAVSAVVPQIKELITQQVDQAKAEAASQIKMYAIGGSLVAGLLGVYVGYQIVKRR